MHTVAFFGETGHLVIIIRSATDTDQSGMLFCIFCIFLPKQWGGRGAGRVGLVKFGIGGEDGKIQIGNGHTFA